MRKKALTKLTLSRETVRHLEEQTLQNVAGGCTGECTKIPNNSYCPCSFTCQSCPALTAGC